MKACRSPARRRPSAVRILSLMRFGARAMARVLRLASGTRLGAGMGHGTVTCSGNGNMAATGDVQRAEKIYIMYGAGFNQKNNPSPHKTGTVLL